MTRPKSLWTDVEALARLARSGRVAEDASSKVKPVRGPRSRHSYPAFPDHLEFDIHGADSPARGVAGDSFDFFFVNDDTLAFLIADVSGKGLPAGILMGVTRSMVRNLTPVSKSPGEVLTRVNEILYQTDLGPMFVTIFLGWYDTRTGALRYTNAGHPHPYLMDGVGNVTPRCKTTGPILGILEVEEYAVREEQLQVGDRLALFTDGVTEAVDPQGEFLGNEGLERILKQHAAEPVNKLCETVIQEVVDYQDSNLQDDATFLLIRRNA